MVGGVEADQVVHAPAPPGGPRGLDQVGAVQILKDLLGGVVIHVGESSCALCRQVGTGVEGAQAEQSC